MTVPPEAGAKFRQKFLYGSAEWKANYNVLRNTNEGMNGYVKDSAYEQSAIPADAGSTEWPPRVFWWPYYSWPPTSERSEHSTSNLE